MKILLIFLINEIESTEKIFKNYSHFLGTFECIHRSDVSSKANKFTEANTRSKILFGQETFPRLFGYYKINEPIFFYYVNHHTFLVNGKSSHVRQISKISSIIYPSVNWHIISRYFLTLDRLTCLRFTFMEYSLYA